MERECGLAGSLMETASFSGFETSWKCKVESHDADMSNAGL
jgi:hypothetical protein